MVIGFGGFHRMFSFCFDRESGFLTDDDFRKDFVTRLCEQDLVLCENQPDCTVLGAIQSLRVERIEDRYILVGCADGQLAIYDQDAFVTEHGKKPLAVVARGDGVSMHSKGVSVADWFCSDTGMFNVGSFDGSVGVWDTNLMECAHLYHVSSCVNVIASGVFAESSSLIAVGTKSDQLRLLDIRQEANAHTLNGHSEEVTCLAWSNLSEHVLVSGDVVGTVFVWDVRKPVPIASLGSKTPPQVIGALSRSGAAPPPRPAKRHKMQSLSYLEKQVDQVVQSARTRVQKSDVTAHSSSVSSLLFSPKTMFLYSFSFGRGRNGGEAPNLKVWDSQNFDLLHKVELQQIRDRRHVAARFDMCCSEQPLDRNQRVFLGLEASVVSLYPVVPEMSTKWPSGHGAGGLVSMQHNKGTQQFYSSGADGVFRVWEYGSLEVAVRPDEADNWDL